MAQPPAAGRDQGQEVGLLSLEDFGSLNTKAQRPAIQSNEFSWIENWFPIGPGNMRTMYAEGATLYTATGGRTIIYKQPYNLGSISYIALFLSDGSAVQVRRSDGVTTSIAGAGIFWTTAGDLPCACQYQSKYLIIGSTINANAFWVWDGAVLYGSGSVAPQTSIIRGGSGYTSNPTITAYGGSGSGATFTGTISNGALTSVTCANSGLGYLGTDHVSLVVTGGGSSDQARCTPVISATAGVARVEVTNGGSGYTAATTVTFTGGGGAGAQAIVSSLINGVVVGVTVINAGTGYTSAPTVVFTGAPGVGATGIADMRRGQITSITVNSGGTGYIGSPTVVITLPDDTNYPTLQATGIATVTAGVVTAVTVTNPGLGYTNAAVELQGGNNAANVLAYTMPQGIQATSIETYQNIVWTSVGTKMSFTGPNSVSDFSTVGGGGSAPATDAFLRRQITCLKQANGFLYRFGDSSINVISNVQTGTGGITTYNNSNVDAQVGTPYRDTIVSFGRALVFANSSGVYALYGGAAEKVSQPLDGLFAAASFNTGQSGLTPSAATATIFGIRVYILLFTATDTYSRTLRNIMCIWDGQKWFASSQIKTPTIISAQEIDSVLTAWAADGTNLYPMFQTASASLAKTFQTKLNAATGINNYLQVNRVYLMAQTNTADPSAVTITIDRENQQSAPAVTTNLYQAPISWTGLASAPLSWSGLASASLEFAVTGLTITGYQESAYGRMIGATLTTNAVDVTFLNLSLLAREYATYG
jgi:hypothetical protein